MSTTATTAQELRWRKQLHAAIVELSDCVDEKQLLEQLPYLDVSSWNEIVEERFLDRSCGMPTCDKKVQPTKSQMYHIDRRQKKIYETNKERQKFCSEACFSRAASLRSQLSSEPIWITGATEERMKKEFRINEFVDEPASESTSIEIVSDDVLISKLSDLRVAERDAESSESEDEHIDEAMTSTLEAVKNFVISQADESNSVPPQQPMRAHCPPPARVARTSSCAKASRLPDPQHNDLSKHELNEREKDALERIRQKQSMNKTAVKKTLLVEATALSPMQRQESNVNEENMEVENAIGSDDVCRMVPVFQSWITDETRLALRCGVQTAGEVHDAMQRFFAGDAREEPTVRLPAVDNVDVKTHRIRVLLQSIKIAWHDLEGALGVDRSQSVCLIPLATTFHLDADNVAGFSRQERKVLCVCLWRLVCLLNDELLPVFYADDGQVTSSALKRLLQQLNFPLEQYKQHVVDFLE